MPINAYFFGFSWWKRGYIRPFFDELEHPVYCSDLKTALKKGLSGDARIYIWGKKPFPEVEDYSQSYGIPLYRVEDGFVRSLSLGSDLTRPYSLVIDSRGIYFDPRHSSDLEYILNTYEFDRTIIDRAQKLQEYLVARKISKYNIYPGQKLVLPGREAGQKVLLVPGQVEDDASIIYGADGMSNLELLQQVKENAPDAYIVYKPHPDVLVGNRKGEVKRGEALRYCDAVITDASLDSVLVLADEVHTMTSLVGFEALLRGKQVHTYGMPFYAGWGLTVDIRRCERRERSRTLDELVAATYILYPRYLNPETGKLCEVEELLEVLDGERSRYNTDKMYKMQVDLRNWFSRKMQWVLRGILGN